MPASALPNRKIAFELIGQSESMFSLRLRLTALFLISPYQELPCDSFTQDPQDLRIPTDHMIRDLRRHQFLALALMSHRELRDLFIVFDIVLCGVAHSLEWMRKSKSRIYDGSLLLRSSSWGNRERLYAPLFCSFMEGQQGPVQGVIFSCSEGGIENLTSDMFGDSSVMGWDFL